MPIIYDRIEVRPIDEQYVEIIARGRGLNQERFWVHAESVDRDHFRDFFDALEKAVKTDLPGLWQNRGTLDKHPLFAEVFPIKAKGE